MRKMPRKMTTSKISHAEYLDAHGHILLRQNLQACQPMFDNLVSKSRIVCGHAMLKWDEAKI